MVQRILKKTEWMSWGLVALACAIMFAPSLGGWIGRMEGSFFPVLHPTLTITDAQAREGETVLKGHATKVRECSYIQGSLRWYLGEQGGFRVFVPSRFEDPPTLRGEGETEWTGIVVVGVSRNQVEALSFATVQHDCGWPWLTESIFFTSEAR